MTQTLRGHLNVLLPTCAHGFTPNTKLTNCYVFFLSIIQQFTQQLSGYICVGGTDCPPSPPAAFFHGSCNHSFFKCTTLLVIWPKSVEGWAQLLMQCGSWLTYTVLSSSSVLSAAVMAVLLVLLSLLLLSIHTPSRASPSCPVSCRCYSLTVECGSTGLRDIPKHIPPSTQVDSWCWRRTIANITTDISTPNQNSYIR